MHATVTNTRTGIAFTVRLVRNGDRYGLDNCLICTTGPLVEFYDKRHNFDRDPEGEMLGQFVARYYVETLLRASPEGLCLDGGVRDWTLDKGAMLAAQDAVRVWLKE